MEKVTAWFGMEVKPWHQGVFELRNASNTVEKCIFSKGVWCDTLSKEPIDTRQFLGWRGRIQKYPESKIQEVVEMMESGHQRRYVVPLFRHWVSVGDSTKACRYFQIGGVLGAKFRVYDKRAYKRIFKKLTASQSLKVEKSVKQFFGRF